MRELFYMFVPEYSITPKILKNISEIEYGRSIIENTNILPTLEKKLQKEATIRIVSNSLEITGLNYPRDDIRKIIDHIKKPERDEISNFLNIFETLKDLAKNTEQEDTDLKFINSQLTKNIVPKVKQGIYRSRSEENHTNPEEIPAQLVQFYDWYNGLDAKETHPIITSAIVKAVIELISPFDKLNSPTANFASLLTLRTANYSFKNFICIEEYYKKTKREYEQKLDEISLKDPDFTRWIEYYSEGFALETSYIWEKVKVLEKDTKLAKASGRIKLTPRQERLIEYLQDYGIVQNRDFSRIFPNISEDSILRDLKTLINKEIVVKKGSTKSSRYELS